MKKLLSTGLIAFLIASVYPVLIFSAIAEDAPPLPPVENLTVKSVGNESVTLTWDALDEAESYIINIGTETGGVERQYNRGTREIDQVTEYKVDNLENEQEYFFAVIGVNPAYTSTIGSLSDEVNATPTQSGSSADEATPFMLGVEAIDDTSVKIVFSEDIVWPENPIENITITKRFDSSQLNLELVTIENETTLLLKTAVQSPGSEYFATINEFFLDADDNPVDDDKRSLIFIGATTDEEVENADTLTEFKVDDIIVVDASSLELVFSRNVKLSENPVSQFAVVRTDSPDDILQIQEIKENTLEGNKVLIKTEPQLNVSYSMLISNLEDAEGNLLPEANTTLNFIGYKSSSEVDESAPEDVSDLKVEKVEADGSSVKLSWTHSSNTAGDLKEYKVYTKENDGDFNLAQTISADQNEFLIEGLPTEGSFIFKVSALDSFSNESQGVSVNLDNELVIAETGPGNLLFVLLAAAFSSFVLRQKRLSLKS